MELARRAFAVTYDVNQHLRWESSPFAGNQHLRWESSPTMGIITYDGNHHLRWGALTYYGIIMELGFYIANLTWLNLTSAERFRRHLRWESNGATFSLASLEGVGLLKVIFF